MDVTVFTNGCFDILHPGHIDLLRQARSLGTKLIVGINSDRSVREIKGALRPLLDQDSRAAVLRELRSVDEVRIFDENTPERLIKEIKPQVLVKGGDWQPNQIIGADFVLQNGGRVFSIPFKRDISTSQIVEKIRLPTDLKKFVEGDSSEYRQTDSETLLSAVEKIYQPAEIENIDRAASLFANILKRRGKIGILIENGAPAAISHFAAGLAANFESVKIIQPNSSEEVGKLLCEQNLIVALNSFGNLEKNAEYLLQARENGCQIIVIVSITGRKLAALSDVCVMLEADSLDKLRRQLLVIEFSFRLAANC